MGNRLLYALRNSVLSKAGLFNERFFLYYEDVELSWIRENGHELHYRLCTKCIMKP